MAKLLQAALVVSLILSAIAEGQSPDAAPPAQLGFTDVYAAFHLPPLKDGPNDTLADRAAPLAVVKRAHALGLTARTAIDAWRDAGAALSRAQATAPGPTNPPVIFAGSKGSELNRLLERSGASGVKVTAAALDIDEPIQISQSGLSLDLGSARLTADGKLPYMLRVEAAAGVTITGGRFESGDSAILVNKSDQVTIMGVHIQGLAGSGIVIVRSSRIVVRGNQIGGMGAAPIVLQGGTESSVIERNDVIGNRGSSNMAAAVVVSDRDVDLAVRAEALYGPDRYWVVAQPMMRRLKPPHNNLIVMNHLARNASSAVYIDGAEGNVIAQNLIEGNAKEGICLDNGATANVVTLNDVMQNGERWGETDAVMEKDAIKGGGRLPNGRPSEKVPGISIDNAIYNVVFSNTVAHNFGGGIKIVRTGFFNAIGLNTILSNNDGQGDKFHFFGVELGAAGLDSPSPGELDAAPSRGNIIFSNAIRGNHYAGIFFAEGSDTNDVFDNLIMDAEKWALESVAPMPNSSLNNFTNIATRNISAGISPALLNAASR